MSDVRLQKYNVCTLSKFCSKQRHLFDISFILCQAVRTNQPASLFLLSLNYISALCVFVNTLDVDINWSWPFVCTDSSCLTEREHPFCSFIWREYDVNKIVFDKSKKVLENLFSYLHLPRQLLDPFEHVFVSVSFDGVNSSSEKQKYHHFYHLHGKPSGEDLLLRCYTTLYLADFSGDDGCNLSPVKKFLGMPDESQWKSYPLYCGEGDPCSDVENEPQNDCDLDSDTGSTESTSDSDAVYSDSESSLLEEESSDNDASSSEDETLENALYAYCTTAYFPPYL